MPVDLSDPNQNPLAKFFSISTFINTLVPIIMLIAGVVFLGMLLFGAFTFMTAGGNPEKIKSAGKIFGFSVLGFFIMVFAYFFVRLLTTILHVPSPF